MLRCQQLSRTYLSGGRELTVLKDITFELEPGGFLAIVGPSGSGKTTLLGLLAGLDRPTTGRVILDGSDLNALDENARARLRGERVGFVFQSFNLIPTLNAIENITLPLDLAGREYDDEWIGSVVKTVRLMDRLDHRPSELSGGQQQRVAVARALAGRPKIIFADEPTGNLDSRAGTEILTFMRQAVIDLEQTIVMVTHDPVAASYANRVLFLSDGKIVSQLFEPSATRIIDHMKLHGDV